MEFKAECGCKLEYPDLCVVSDLGTKSILKGVDGIRPKIIRICEKHKYEFLTKYLKMFGTVTYAQIRRTFKIPESEVLSLLREIAERDNGVEISIHEFVVTRIN